MSRPRTFNQQRGTYILTFLPLSFEKKTNFFISGIVNNRKAKLLADSGTRVSIMTPKLVNDYFIIPITIRHTAINRGLIAMMGIVHRKINCSVHAAPTTCLLQTWSRAFMKWISLQTIFPSIFRKKTTSMTQQRNDTVNLSVCAVFLPPSTVPNEQLQDIILNSQQNSGDADFNNKVQLPRKNRVNGDLVPSIAISTKPPSGIHT